MLGRDKGKRKAVSPPPGERQRPVEYDVAEEFNQQFIKPEPTDDLQPTGGKDDASSRPDVHHPSPTLDRPDPSSQTAPPAPSPSLSTKQLNVIVETLASFPTSGLLYREAARAFVDHAAQDLLAPANASLLPPDPRSFDVLRAGGVSGDRIDGIARVLNRALRQAQAVRLAESIEDEQGLRDVLRTLVARVPPYLFEGLQPRLWEELQRSVGPPERTAAHADAREPDELLPTPSSLPGRRPDDGTRPPHDSYSTPVQPHGTPTSHEPWPMTQVYHAPTPNESRADAKSDITHDSTGTSATPREPLQATSATDPYAAFPLQAHRATARSPAVEQAPAGSSQYSAKSKTKRPQCDHVNVHPTRMSMIHNTIQSNSNTHATFVRLVVPLRGLHQVALIPRHPSSLISALHLDEVHGACTAALGSNFISVEINNERLAAVTVRTNQIAQEVIGQTLLVNGVTLDVEHLRVHSPNWFIADCTNVDASDAEVAARIAQTFATSRPEVSLHRQGPGGDSGTQYVVKIKRSLDLIRFFVPLLGSSPSACAFVACFKPVYKNAVCIQCNVSHEVYVCPHAERVPLPPPDAVT